MEDKIDKIVDIKAINEKIERESAFVDILSLEMNKVIVGQKNMVERLWLGFWEKDIFYLKGSLDWQKH